MKKLLLVAMVVIFTVGISAAAYAAYQTCPQTCTGTNSPDRLDGTDTPDEIYGLDGSDVIHPGKGDDYVEGGNGHDFIDESTPGENVGNDADVIYGNDGADNINVADGDLAATDEVNCGNGDDIVYMDHADSAAANCEKVIEQAYAT